MFKRNLVAAAALGLLLLPLAFLRATDDPAPADGKRIEDLVKQLGSSKFLDRERAKKELEGIGAPALPALRKAAKDENLETSKRAEEIVRKIEDRALTAELLNPKTIRLNVTNMPVAEAVKKLSDMSGYQMQIMGDMAAISEKKITLDTGDVPFFQALDKLCAAAGLNDKINVITPGATFPGIRPVRPPVIIRPIKGKLVPLPAPAPMPVPLPVPGVLPVVPPGAPGAAPGGVPGVVPGAAPRNVPEAVPALPAPAFPGVPLPAVPARPIENPPVLDLNSVVVPADEPAKAPEPKVAPAKKAIAVPAVIGPVQILPAPADDIVIGPGGVPAGAPIVPITLNPGDHKPVPTSYAGSVRIRALTAGNLPAGAKKGEIPVLVFDAAAEPRLKNFTLVGNPTVHKAIDDQGQELSVTFDTPKVDRPAGPRDDVIVFPNPYMAPAVTLQQTIGFKKGEKASKMLKEFSGVLTAQVQIPNEELIRIENVMVGGGKTVKSSGPGSITVVSADKQDDGSVKMQLRLENMNNPFGGGAMFNGVVVIGGAGGMAIGGRGGESGVPDLIDAKGVKYQMAGVSNTRVNFNGGVLSQEVTVLYRPNGAGAPASLVLFGNRTVNFQVPFSFTNVPLE